MDSTFKTNNYEISLYAAVVPNNDGCGISVFYMVCSKDKGQGHQGIPVEIALKYIFKKMDIITPNAILIEKYITNLNVITIIMKNEFFVGRINE